MNSHLAYHTVLITNLRNATAWRMVVLCIVAVWLWMVFGAFGQPHLSTDAMLVLATLLGGTALSYGITRSAPALTLAADLATRLILPDRDLKLGVIMALVGAPLFLHLIYKTRSEIS